MAGLEVLYSCTKSQLKSREDAIVCCLHWGLVSNGYKCTGIGEQVQDAAVTEMLPDGWNNSQEFYALQYRPNTDVHDANATFELKIVKADSSLLVHLLRMKDEKVVTMTIEIPDYTTQDLTSFTSTYKNIDELQKRFKAEIVDEMSKKEGDKLRENTTQSRARQVDPDRHRPDPDDPLRIGPPRGPQRQAPPEWGDPGDPFSIGRGDLDPLHGGMGGGMMYDPMRSGRVPGPGYNPSSGLPGRLPQGAVPPGARFDPFGPDLDGRGNFNPRGGPRGGPDPDHLPPPGYGDMFM